MGQVQQFLEYIFKSFKIWVIIQPWEEGIRVRAGKKQKKLKGGMYFKLPYLDSVYVQEVRLRIVNIPVQTLTSKDDQTITLSSTMGYVITDIQKVYNTLFHPEMTVKNIVMSETSKFIKNQEAGEVDSSNLSKLIVQKVNEQDYGIELKTYEVINFAIVKTFRLIQDQSWMHESLSMNEKK